MSVSTLGSWCAYGGHVCVCVCVCTPVQMLLSVYVCEHAGIMACIWRPEEQLNNSFFPFFSFFLGGRQGFTVAIKPILELALIDQVGLKLTGICLPLPAECWD